VLPSVCEKFLKFPLNKNGVEQNTFLLCHPVGADPGRRLERLPLALAEAQTHTKTVCQRFNLGLAGTEQSGSLRVIQPKPEIEKNIVSYHRLIAIYRNYHNRTGLPNQILFANVEYKGLKNITRIRAMDLATNGTGGIARIISGGIGQRNVTIQLSSAQAGLGYYFYVDVYGY
jgi:Transcription activator MBF2